MADETTLEVSPSIDTLVVRDLTSQILTTDGDTLIVPSDDITFLTIGTPGPPGPEGQASTVPGPEGPPGSGGDKTYVHVQLVPSDVWTITHSLGKYPSVSVIDSANSQVFGEVNYIDTSTVEVTFSSGFAGKASLN